MPVKAKKKDAKAKAPLVDPLIAAVLAAIKEARSATEKPAEMYEDDPDVEDQTAKATDAQQAVINSVYTYVSREKLLKVTPSVPEPDDYEREMAMMSLFEAVQQCRDAQTEDEDSRCKERLQKAAKRLAETATKSFGFQMAKPWAPSVKDNEEGQNQRIREPVESVVNDDEPPEDAFGPYPTEPKINKYLLEDGTIEAGNSVEVNFKKKEDSDQEMLQDGEKNSGGEADSEEHGHADSDDDPDFDAQGDDKGDDDGDDE